MSDQTTEPEHLKVKEAAIQLGYGLTTVYELFEEGELIGFRRRRKGIRIFAWSVADYIKRQSNAAPAPAEPPAATAGPEKTREPAVLPMRKVKPRAARRGRKMKTFEDVVLVRSA